MGDVRLIHRTEDAEKLILYMARVSTPSNQHSEDTRLLSYLIKHKHWSPFEMVSMAVEIKTNRAISAQILRHRSFSFQEASQRYAEVHEFEKIQPRRQAEKNRQSSVDDLEDDVKDWWAGTQLDMEWRAQYLYKQALERGIARETARFLLPTSAATTLFMHGTLRSWVHYIALRTEEGVQQEHREIALAIKEIFKQEFPILSKALDWDLK